VKKPTLEGYYRTAIIQLLDEAGLNPHSISFAMDVSAGNIYRFVRGDRDGLGFSLQEALADYFGMTVLEVLNLGRDLLEEKNSDKR